MNKNVNYCFDFINYSNYKTANLADFDNFYLADQNPKHIYFRSNQNIISFQNANKNTALFSKMDLKICIQHLFVRFPGA